MFLRNKIEKAVELVNNAEQIQIITHIDADGLSAGGILSTALQRLGKDFSIKTLPGIYPDNPHEFETTELTIFSDFGSGQLNILNEKFNGIKTIIFDHHQVSGKEWPELLHINPCLEGFDGATEISGAGVAYIFARELSRKNIDLSALALVGAVGDVQNLWGKFKSFNSEILQDAISAKVVEKESDILLFGRHTRPVYKALQYFTDPFVPGISNSESGAISLLNSLGIKLKAGYKWRALIDLKQDEKQRIADELIQRAMERIPPELTNYVPSLVIGEVYTMLKEQPKSELRGASEFSTCLNATGRNEKPELGLKIACGERDSVYKELLTLLAKHRRNLAKGLEFLEQTGISVGPRNYLQYFNANIEIKPSLVGTVASMFLGSETTDPYKPIVGFSYSESGIKVSARCSRILVLQKINMASAIRKAAEAVGGLGGGHSVACGAFIPHGKMKKFIELFENALLSAL